MFKWFSYEEAFKFPAIHLPFAHFEKFECKEMKKYSEMSTKR